jgi:hypothetical protein
MFPINMYREGFRKARSDVQRVFRGSDDETASVNARP